MLDVKKVFFSYGDRFALRDINLIIHESELVFLTGANGSGKTTLLKLLSGLLPFQEGEILYNKSKVTHRELRYLTGYVFHNPLEQLFNFTVEDEIAFGLENMGVEREEMLKQVDQTLKSFDLERYRLKDPAKLSGGQAQKVAIASIVVLKPKFLFLDEPTGMLDDDGIEQVKSCLTSLLKSGLSIIVSTHELWHFHGMISRVIHLNQGSIDFDGSYEEFKKKNFEDVEMP